MQLNSVKLFLREGADMHYENFSGVYAEPSMCEACAHNCPSSSYELARRLMNTNFYIWDQVTLRMWRRLFDESFS